MMSVIRQLGDGSIGGAATYGGTTAGTSSSYTLAMTPPIAAYTTGRIYTFNVHVDNSPSCLLNIDGKGAKPIRKTDGGLLEIGDLRTGTTYEVVDIGTSFRMLSPWGADRGSAALRDVGTASGNLPEIANGSGQFNAAVDAAHKTLDNLSGDGVRRTTWASIAFGGAGNTIATFGGAAVVRNGPGLYTISFPSIGGGHAHVSITIDHSPTGENAQSYVVAGTRTATGVQIVTNNGNSSPAPFDPARVSVQISRIL
ncbi:hypothetical protein BWR60_09610 [Inquilinus limosus]|uniref:Uncharacterized protein n=2 Tax=Inquilinus limosus TaxID=171674 RepID=A0A211ZQ96_9PROT|nr:hypothetical protein BWR60_09610 [Inquilinus limosus]